MKPHHPSGIRLTRRRLPWSLACGISLASQGALASLCLAQAISPVQSQGGNAIREDEPAILDQATLFPRAFSDQGIGLHELDVDSLVERVLAQNPSLAQMQAAWRAASTRAVQVTSLDDPMFSATVAPASIGSREVDFGYRLEVSQKYPFPGKLALRGQNAEAEARAACHDVEDMRLQLIESTKSAFYDYYLVGRAEAVNRTSVALLKEFRDNAGDRYKTGLVPQQDVLQAEVELGRQAERQITLERMRRVAIAKINTLLHLPPDSPLPAPPDRLDQRGVLPDITVLRSSALSQRPDLQAMMEHIRAEQASLGLAQKEFRPDFEVTAAYDTIMGNGSMHDLAPQVGVRVNLPFRKAKRCGAVAEARARLAQRQAELDKQIDQANFQVQEAYEQARESERVVELYEQTILPAAEANVKAAQSAYVTGKSPFLSLIEAERNLVMLRDRRYEAQADYYRRLATLERAVGGGPHVGAPAAAASEGNRSETR